ncbi:MAG: VOC family protein [Actinobacteria bacterium]|nr:MAG: VOC family protein [Actinomycetota bacterium]
MPSLEIDHVIVAVDDLDRAAARLSAASGLTVLAGGRHPGHGTGNMIVPLGTTYLELMAVVDREEAAGSILGRFVTDRVAAGGGPMALCLRTDDIAAIAGERAIELLAMGRRKPDGSELSWHLAGLDQAFGEERLPFFIEWHAAPGDHPAETGVHHPGGAAALERVVVGGSEARLHEWVGGAVLPIEVAAAPPGVLAAHLTIGGDPFVIWSRP